MVVVQNQILLLEFRGIPNEDNILVIKNDGKVMKSGSRWLWVTNEKWWSRLENLSRMLVITTRLKTEYHKPCMHDPLQAHIGNIPSNHNLGTLLPEANPSKGVPC